MARAHESWVRERKRLSKVRKREGGLVEIKRASERQRCELSWAGYKYLVSSSVALASLPSFYSGSSSFLLWLPPSSHHQVGRSPRGNSDRILQWQQRWNNGNEGPTLFEEMGDRMIDTTGRLLSCFLATWWQGFPHAHHYHDSSCNRKCFPL